MIRQITLVGLGLLLGIVVFGAARFVAQPPHEHVHYHANWAIFVDSVRLDLTANRYMEDVLQCTADPSLQRPEDRVHMHENNHDVVHVHASGVTWGHLLANLGFGIGDDYLITDSGRYESGEERSLRFVLNGSPMRSIRNLQIDDRDRLLISFGAEATAEVVETQFPLVGDDAGEFNTMPDPASCSGQEEETLGARLRRAIWY
ncbi:MAG: hypothetical protein WD737_07770 [Gemmatimonadota bacterium]